jgi:hypothetical protein
MGTFSSGSLSGLFKEVYSDSISKLITYNAFMGPKSSMESMGGKYYPIVKNYPAQHVIDFILSLDEEVS